MSAEKIRTLGRPTRMLGSLFRDRCGRRAGTAYVDRIPILPVI
jgi:hypothetical protein